jgi:hypothetical protein
MAALLILLSGADPVKLIAERLKGEAFGHENRY